MFNRLDTPSKIQDFLNSLKFNFEENGQTCMSPRKVLREKKAHCMEGAIFAAAILEYHGHKPLILDLRAAKRDFDHTVAVFKQFGCFGAVSKTNHAVLRYREPIYKTIRELALSFFHEYFDDNGRKNLREYSELLDLSYFDHQKRGAVNWRTTEEDIWDIPFKLDNIKHHRILSPAQEKNLRLADAIEVRAGKLVERRMPKKPSR